MIRRSSHIPNSHFISPIKITRFISFISSSSKPKPTNNLPCSDDVTHKDQQVTASRSIIWSRVGLFYVCSFRFGSVTKWVMWWRCGFHRCFVSVVVRSGGGGVTVAESSDGGGVGFRWVCCGCHQLGKKWSYHCGYTL